MKTIIVLLATVLATSAHALESHYGKVTRSGTEFACSYTNHGAAKDMKYVIFSFTRMGAHGDEFTIQNRIDQVVKSGETLVAKSGGFTGAATADYCRFLAR